MDRISTGTGLNPGGQPSNRHRDRIGKTRSLFVRQRDRVDPVRLAVNVTGSIIADRGITGRTYEFILGGGGGGRGLKGEGVGRG